MSRVDQLRASLARCQDRRTYCERQLSDFAKSANMSDRQQQRALQKLRSDLTRAESDVSWLQKQLDDLMD
jgi:chromosome segregation ATPase